MKKLFAAVSLLACSFAAHATTPSDASLDALLAASGAEASMNAAMTHMESAIRQNMAAITAGKTLTAEQQKFVEAMPGRLVAFMREELNFATLKPQVMQAYRETLTQEDVDGLLAFYRSPAGKTFVEKMPSLMQKSMTLTQARVQAMMPRLQQMMADLQKEAGLAEGR